MLFVHYTRKVSRNITCPSIVTKRESTRHREASSSFRAVQISRQGPMHPILRANPSPKLRIYFADFPHLLYSVDQRLLTLETWCGYGYDQVCKQICPSICHGHLEAHRTPRMTMSFTSQVSSPPSNLISGKTGVKKKRQHFPKLPPALPNSFTLPHVIHVLVGEYEPIPFQDTRQSLRVRSTSCNHSVKTWNNITASLCGGRGRVRRRGRRVKGDALNTSNLFGEKGKT